VFQVLISVAIGIGVAWNIAVALFSRVAFAFRRTGCRLGFIEPGIAVSRTFICDIACPVRVEVGGAIAAVRNVDVEAALARTLGLGLTAFHVVFRIEWH
jgi:hypothetical protein